MASLSAATVTAVYEHALAVAVQKQLTEFTAAQISEGWAGPISTFRNALADLVSDGRLTQVGVAKMKGAPKLYSITELLEELTAPSGENANVAKSKAHLKAVAEYQDVSLLLAEFAAVLGMEMDDATAPLYFAGLKTQLIHMIERINAISKAQLTASQRSHETSSVVEELSKIVGNNTDTMMQHYERFRKGIARISDDVDGNWQGTLAHIEALNKGLQELEAKYEELLRRVKLDRGDWERAFEKRAAVETRNAEDIQPGPFRAGNKQYTPDDQNQQNNVGFRDGYRIGFADGLKMQTLLLGTI